MHCGIIAEDREDIAALAESSFTPGELLTLLDKTAKIEVWHSSFTDPGPDFNEYRVFDADGNLLDTFRTTGY